MFKALILLTLLTLSIFSFSIADDLTNELVTVFKNFKKAAATGKESEIAKYMSPRFLNSHKNNVASMGMDFTPDMITMFSDHYDISKAKLVKTLVNGVTAGLVYDMPIEDEGEYEKDKINFLLLKFVKYNTWKYDNGYSTYKSKIDDNGKPTVFLESFIPEEVAVDGKIPEAPAVMLKAEIQANYFVMGMGYKIELSVNGNSAVISGDGSSSGLLPGGIRYGKNKVSLTITKTPSKQESYPSVKIYYAGKDNKKIDAFELNKVEKKTGTIRTSFIVNK